MLRLTSTTRWVIFAIIALACSALTVAAAKYAVADYWEQSSNPALWLRAAEIEPSNAGNWYRLGRYRQLDFENSDLPLAISYYERAVRIDPGASSVWLDLGSAYETAGDLARADQAYRKAQEDYPISSQVAWEYGNFLLRQNRTQQAFQQIRRAVSVSPALTPLAVSRCWRGTQDIDQILQFALPATPEAYWGAIEFFVRADLPVPATAVWKRLAADKTSFPISNAFPMLDLLVRSGDAEDARVVWQQALSSAAIAPEYSPAGSLIWNGGFEHDLLNGGLAWQYKTVAGATMSLDQETFHSGNRSLRVVFDGSANVDFSNLWQYVVVEPNTHYRFSVYMRADDLTTDSGIRFEVYDLKQAKMAATTTNVVGTQAWTLAQADLTTGRETHLLQIALRRFQSTMLGNKIRGAGWVDDASLVPLPASSPDAK